MKKKDIWIEMGEVALFFAGLGFLIWFMLGYSQFCLGVLLGILHKDILKYFNHGLEFIFSEHEDEK